jgi:hypothetical protein
MRLTDCYIFVLAREKKRQKGVGKKDKREKDAVVQ